MTTLTAPAPDVNLDSDAPADVEPTGPSAADAAWWAEQTRDDDPEPDWDAMADEALAQDLLEMGLGC